MNEEGQEYEQRYLFEQDESAVIWIGNYRNTSYTIYGSEKAGIVVYGGINRLEPNKGDISPFFKKERDNTHSYFFVDYITSSSGNITLRSEDGEYSLDFEEYQNDLEKTNKIYTSGACNIYCSTT